MCVRLSARVQFVCVHIRQVHLAAATSMQDAHLDLFCVCVRFFFTIGVLVLNLRLPACQNVYVCECMRVRVWASVCVRMLRGHTHIHTYTQAFTFGIFLSLSETSKRRETGFKPGGSRTFSVTRVTSMSQLQRSQTALEGHRGESAGADKQSSWWYCVCMSFCLSE